jgi:hypothetical protein
VQLRNREGTSLGRAPTVHFVYNVDGTPRALAHDFVLRLTDPGSYPCRLCDVTYGRFFKKAEWSAFVAGLPIDARFHLRNGFRRRFPRHAREPLPAVFVEAAPGVLRTLISAEEMGAVADLAALKDLVAKRVGSLAD